MGKELSIGVLLFYFIVLSDMKNKEALDYIAPLWELCLAMEIKRCNHRYISIIIVIRIIILVIITLACKRLVNVGGVYISVGHREKERKRKRTKTKRYK